MSQNLQNFVKFQKFQLDNLVDFEKCCKTHIYLQKSVPIQPKTNNILPKFCQKLATTLITGRSPARRRRRRGDPGQLPVLRRGRQSSGKSASGRAQLRALTLGGAVWDAFRENANCGDPVGTLSGPCRDPVGDPVGTLSVSRTFRRRLRFLANSGKTLANFCQNLANF